MGNLLSRSVLEIKSDPLALSSKFRRALGSGVRMEKSIILGVSSCALQACIHRAKGETRRLLAFRNVADVAGLGSELVV